MPKVNLEILRTVEITRDENIEVEVEVPAHILADPDSLEEWVGKQLENDDSDLYAATVRNWVVENEVENPTIDEVIVLDDAD